MNNIRDVIIDDTKDVIKNVIRDNFENYNFRNAFSYYIIDDISNYQKIKILIVKRNHRG